MKYYLYARKSTESEERQVMSIDDQIVELEQFAKKEHLQITERFIESKSAEKPGREVFNKMMTKVHEAKDPIGLLSWHPDRLARNSLDGGQIIYCIDIKKITSLRFPCFWFEPTPQGLFMLQVAFGQSKYYSDNLRENVNRGIRNKQLRGEWCSRAPIGYVNNLKTHNIELNLTKSPLVKKAFSEFAKAIYTFDSLATSLNLWGLKNGIEVQLSKSSVIRILTNKVYIGIIGHSGADIKGSFPPIVEKELFYRVQEILKKRSRPRKASKVIK